MANQESRGGSHEQHVKAGEQSHKNTSGGSSQGGSQGQHAKAGQQSHGGGAEHNPGNFAQDREKASEAGRKGGQQSHGGAAKK
jgi:general stress protein YciG